MPILGSHFHPPLPLRNPHVQTLLASLLPRSAPRDATQHTLELSDGDFLSLWSVSRGFRRLAILCHGLEGSFHSPYIRGMASTLLLRGWDVLAWNYRGCGPQPNRLLRFYHSGATEDLRAVLAHAAEGYQSLALVGFSLGGNLVLKYLGEPSPNPAITSAAALSAPIDLASSAHALDTRPANRLYLHRFLSTLRAKIRAKAARFPDAISLEPLKTARSFATFDDAYTARLHGFHNAQDYWTRCSALHFLPHLTVPTLLLNALDDPFLATPSFPHDIARNHPALWLETPAHGGHVGFLQHDGHLHPWSELRVAQFLS